MDVKKFGELKKHMHLQHCFTRRTVAEAIARMNGVEHRDKHDFEASKLLREARAIGYVCFIQNRARSCYYNFTVDAAAIAEQQHQGGV